MKPFEIKKNMLELRERWRKHPDYNCFWSGPDNERGLRLTPTIEPGRVFVDTEIEKFQSGFPGIANGGVSFTILDGLMSWYLMSHHGRAGFTKSADLQYFMPLHVGKRYRFEVRADAASDQENSPVHYKLVGEVFRLNSAGEVSNREPAIAMRAAFFLPDRKTAEQVLRIELGPEGEEVFPEDGRAL